MTSTPKRYLYCSKSDKGIVRSNNEDSHLELPDAGIWAVADGMGGHANGEIASKIVVTTLKTVFASNPPNTQTLDAALNEAHQQILKAVDDGLGSKGMGSTVVALACHEYSYQIAWVGDSRAYRWTPGQKPGGELLQLTSDHSLVQTLVNQKIISSAEAAEHPERHIITQCLGAHGTDIQVDQVSDNWRDNQWILLCSDGLTNELSDQDIANILAQNNNIQTAASALLEAALASGGRDNITLQIITLGKKKSITYQLKQLAQRLFKHR